jgi:hypothetical protein
MIDVVCSLNPLSVGESRTLQVSGNGPFTVKVGCFVTDPSPLGLQDYSSQTVEAHESFQVKADADFWNTHKGGLQIDITDATGARRRLHFNVQAAARSFSKGLVRA